MLPFFTSCPSLDLTPTYINELMARIWALATGALSYKISPFGCRGRAAHVRDADGDKHQQGKVREEI
jgi:hypothetical protein